MGASEGPSRDASEAASMEATEAAPVTTEDRKEILNDRIVGAVRNGYQVESQSDFQGVMLKGKRPNHILHLILTIFTGGLWGLFVWLPLAIFKHEKRIVIVVDQQGRATQVNKSGR